jgi:hypothetical protein
MLPFLSIIYVQLICGDMFSETTPLFEAHARLCHGEGTVSDTSVHSK